MLAKDSLAIADAWAKPLPGKKFIAISLDMFLSSTFVCDAIVPANGSAKPTIPPDLPAVAAESKSKYFYHHLVLLLLSLY